MRRVLILLLAAACGGDDEPAAPGTETGPCNEERCLEGLVCLSNTCVDPGSGTGEDGNGNEGGPGSMGEDDSAAESSPAESSGDGGMTGDESDSDPDPDPDSTSTTDGDPTDPSADEAGDSGFEPECVAYATGYCACLGDIAADDCFENIADSCDILLDFCPDWLACAIANPCPFDEQQKICGDCV